MLLLFLYGLMKYFYLDLSPLEQLDSKITMLTRIHAQLSGLENSMNLQKFHESAEFACFNLL
jgi:hypothetical protein